MSSPVLNIIHLPNEILLHIFYNSDFITLSVCCQVNKLFNDTISQSNDLWKCILGNIPYLPENNTVSFVRNNCMLNSKKIDWYTTQFLKSIPPCTKGIIEFVFTRSPKSKITITFAYGKGASLEATPNKILNKVLKKTFLVFEEIPFQNYNCDIIGPLSCGLPNLIWEKYAAVSTEGINRLLADKINQTLYQVIRKHADQRDSVYRSYTIYYTTAVAVAGLAAVTKLFWG